MVIARLFQTRGQWGRSKKKIKSFKSHQPPVAKTRESQTMNETAKTRARESVLLYTKTALLCNWHKMLQSPLGMLNVI